MLRTNHLDPLVVLQNSRVESSGMVGVCPTDETRVQRNDQTRVTGHKGRLKNFIHLDMYE